jgi:gamma-glutamyl hercynylcysteine S-oxide synthase
MRTAQQLGDNTHDDALDNDFTIHDAQAMRNANAQQLAQAFAQGRQQLLSLHAQLHAQLRDKPLPELGTLNPLLWELGHVAWFEEWWLARNPERALGVACEPDVSRLPSLLPNADALYDSSHVPHHTRWHLPLPSYEATLTYVQAVRAQTLSLLAQAKASDADLYFFRLVLFHEDMHREALLYMAQTQSLSLDPPCINNSILNTGYSENQLNTSTNINIPNTVYALGSNFSGFVFDNELGKHDITLAAYDIDAQAVTWQQFMPFIQADGYANQALWSELGWHWLHTQPIALPRYLRLHHGQWQRQTFGEWQALDMHAAACNLSYYEAEAWCRWAGRRLPTEAEWECAVGTAVATLVATAVATHASDMHWGEVWEWTASEFTPYPGFAPHPYLDYSAPWFSGRQVLRGGSCITASRMKHPKYRNFFTPDRNDVFAGFRSCTKSYQA